MDTPTITFHLTSAVTCMAQVAISFYVIAAYKRTHEWGFGLIALATIIYFWNVGFHYFVQLGLFVPEARWSKRDSDLIYALDAGAYIVGAVLDVLGIARLCKVYRSAPRAGSNHGLTGR